MKSTTVKYQYLLNVTTQEADVIIQKIAFGKSVSGQKGTQNAPDAILEASNQIEYYDEDLEWSPMKYMNICVRDNVHKYKDISQQVNSFNLRENQLLISLGGDHSITPQVTQGLLKNETLIVFLDAHADLRSSYMGNKWSHATPAFHLLKAGHKMIMVGVRSLFEDEAKRIKKDKKIFFFSDRALQKQNEREKLLETLQTLEGDVYLSIDMDVFNPAYVPSVGTPQAGGIDYYFATDILEALFFNSHANIKGVDMVELIPEVSGVSQNFAAKLLQKIISYWGKSQGFHKRKALGAQTKVEYE